MLRLALLLISLIVQDEVVTEWFAHSVTFFYPLPIAPVPSEELNIPLKTMFTFSIGTTVDLSMRV